MGDLAKRVREKSLWIKLEIGEESAPITYKGWKEITGQFGDSFRYMFEVQTDKGLMTKQFDCGQSGFANAMDTIPFGAVVVITRNQKVDGNNNVIEGKSFYSVKEVR